MLKLHCSILVVDPRSNLRWTGACGPEEFQLTDVVVKIVAEDALLVRRRYIRRVATVDPARCDVYESGRRAVVSNGAL